MWVHRTSKYLFVFSRCEAPTDAGFSPEVAKKDTSCRSVDNWTCRHSPSSLGSVHNIFVVDFMGQVCSCLEPRQRKKRERRLSDASTEPPDYDSSINGEFGDDSDGDEIRILIDGGADESDSLLASSSSSRIAAVSHRAAVMTKRNSKSALLRAQTMTTTTTARSDIVDPDTSPVSYLRGSGNATKLMGEQQANPLSDEEQRRNLDVLRSYQQVTGIVDPGQLDLECVMCLDTFASDNPKVRSLCNCGMNRTNFHLSCLLEWLNRDANCPVCRQYLFYEEP